ncbi:MAG: hypothetical protein R3F55_01960 [Alphaproteobacteria bacterium]
MSARLRRVGRRRLVGGRRSLVAGWCRLWLRGVGCRRLVGRRRGLVAGWCRFWLRGVGRWRFIGGRRSLVAGWCRLGLRGVGCRRLVGRRRGLVAGWCRLGLRGVGRRSLVGGRRSLVAGRRRRRVRRIRAAADRRQHLRRPAAQGDRRVGIVHDRGQPLARGVQVALAQRRSRHDLADKEPPRAVGRVERRKLGAQAVGTGRLGLQLGAEDPGDVAQHSVDLAGIGDGVVQRDRTVRVVAFDRARRGVHPGQCRDVRLRVVGECRQRGDRIGRLLFRRRADRLVQRARLVLAHAYLIGAPGDHRRGAGDDQHGQRQHHPAVAAPQRLHPVFAQRLVDLFENVRQ